jgi:hypothetical protein
VLVLGVGALRIASRGVRLSEAHRRERRIWARETETLREAVASEGKRIGELEGWRITLRNRNNGRD